MSNRIYYAIQQVGIKPVDSSTFTVIHGLQSVGINSNISLSSIPLFGQTYSHGFLEEASDIQVSLNKVLDGYPLIYTLSSSGAISPAIESGLLQRCDIGLSIFDDANISATGVPINTLQCCNMYINSLHYNFSSNNKDNFTEEISFIGDERLWKNHITFNNPIDNTRAENLSFNGVFSNTDSPLGNVNRRQDILFNGEDGDTTILPIDIIGINSEGQPESNTHVANISISANIGRESILTLGQTTPFFRMPTFPLDITSEIGIIPISGDGISLTTSGILSNGTVCQNSGNLQYQRIAVATCEGTRIFLGNRNKLVSVNQQGGDTAGGIVRVNYTYRTQGGTQSCSILHSGDPYHDWWDNRTDWAPI